MALLNLWQKQSGFGSFAMVTLGASDGFTVV
jgi:hypothetical protein